MLKMADINAERNQERARWRDWLWHKELYDLFLRVGGGVEPRWRMRAYVRSLLGPVGPKNSLQMPGMIRDLCRRCVANSGRQ